MDRMDRTERTRKNAVLSLMGNVAYSAYHITFGHLIRSWWLLTLGVYYLLLSVVRFAVLCLCKSDSAAIRFTGGMLMALTPPLAGTVVLSLVRDRGHRLHMIIMIAMAAYTFTRITLAAVQLAQTRRGTSATLAALRNISFADAVVSIFSLQRSMLVSFEGMEEAEIRLMNALLGLAVCATVFWLGINLLQKGKRNGL